LFQIDFSFYFCGDSNVQNCTIYDHCGSGYDCALKPNRYRSTGNGVGGRSNAIEMTAFYFSF
jgi:hypothetical protein